MPKITELTVEIGVEQVSCPGVWLCQDGRVSLTVFALGTSYQTCLLPPVFPLMFKDIFFFRKRFQDTCALNNLCCLLKDETLYCELVQWSEECASGKCTILAQYLGSLNEVLFPPNMCWSDGVDLLMRRCKDFPRGLQKDICLRQKEKGILSPKIEITTKVRIDEVWNQVHPVAHGGVKVASCLCTNKNDPNDSRQKPVCHTSQYHKYMCQKDSRLEQEERIRSRSSGSKSCCSLTQQMYEEDSRRPGRSQARSARNRRSADCSPRGVRRRQYDYNVYQVQVPRVDKGWMDAAVPSALTDVSRDSEDLSHTTRFDEPLSNISETSSLHSHKSGPLQNSHTQSGHKVIIESRLIKQKRRDMPKLSPAIQLKAKVKPPCVCEICRRYHELFHSEDSEV